MGKKEKKTTKATIEMADNGYILHLIDNPDMLSVYEGARLQDRMYAELFCDLQELIDNSEYTKFKVTVTIEPL